jgi:hypothetical protein
MMGPLRNTALLITLVVAASVSNVSAFTTVSRAALAPKSAFFPSRPLFMAEGDDAPDDGTIITSGRKEIAYDEKTGRFYETGLEEEECVPDEEFCMTDKQSGNLIRLTVEEKERIFLDALQVCLVSLRLFSSLVNNCIFLKHYISFISLAGLLFQW